MQQMFNVYLPLGNAKYVLYALFVLYGTFWYFLRYYQTFGVLFDLPGYFWPKAIMSLPHVRVISHWPSVSSVTRRTFQAVRTGLFCIVNKYTNTNHHISIFREPFRHQPVRTGLVWKASGAKGWNRVILRPTCSLSSSSSQQIG